MAFEVSIRDPRGQSMLVRVNSGMTVLQVRQEFSSRSQLRIDQFKLVFAGQPLPDDARLEDFGVQGYSTLHCIRERISLQATPVRMRQVESNLASVAISETQSGVPSTGKAPQHHFFVYCKKCKDMQPGKLRVRCADCKDPAFVLDMGPGGWEDVLQPRQLHGRCNAEGCRCSDAAFYFKCAGHPSQMGVEEECVALSMIRVNTVCVECLTCADTKEEVVVFDCKSQHVQCKDCFVQQCEFALNSRDFEEHRQYGYTIKCPARCEDSHVKEVHHFRLMGNQNYDRYQRFGAEEYVLQMGGVLCPHAGCGMGILPDDDHVRRIDCPECRHVFCRQCKNDFHTGPCDAGHQPASTSTAQESGRQPLNPDQQLRSQWNTATESFIRENPNIKPCPQCRINIEKNGGCMHMRCRHCRYQWCWICSVPWNGQCQSLHWFG